MKVKQGKSKEGDETRTVGVAILDTKVIEGLSREVMRGGLTEGRE